MIIMISILIGKVFPLLILSEENFILTVPYLNVVHFSYSAAPRGPSTIGSWDSRDV